MSTLQRFATEYQELNKLSEGRRIDQIKELERFARFAGKDILDCDAQDFQRYLAHLVSTKLHVNTVRKRGNFIRPFFTWAFSVKLVSGDRLMEIREVKDPKGASGRTLPRPYTRKEMRQFWDDLDTTYPKVKPIFWQRWRHGRSRYSRVASHVMRIQMIAIVQLALHCGLRKEEIFRLDIDDIHPDNAYVVVKKGKGGKARKVPHTNGSRQAVADWLTMRREMKPKHDRPWLSLHPNQSHRAVRQPIGWMRFGKLMSGIGSWELHRLRHTCATEWLRAGVPLDKLQKLLGHSTLSQTLCYAELLDDDVQKAVELNQDAFEAAVGRAA